MPDEPSVARVFSALGDPTRRALIERLTPGPMSVTRLAEPFDLSLAAVVQHLPVMERAGLIRTEKVGRVRTCQIAPGGLQVATAWISERRSPWERRLDRLGAVVAEATEPARQTPVPASHDEGATQ